VTTTAWSTSSPRARRLQERHRHHGARSRSWQPVRSSGTAAAWALNTTAEQTFPLANGAAISFEADLRYQGRRDTSLQFTDGSRSAASTGLDANLHYRSASGNWDLTAFVNNLINNQAIGRAQATGAGNTVIYFATVGAPRTYGLRTNYRY